MKPHCKPLAAALAAALQLTAPAAVPVAWTNSPGMPPYPLKPVPHGVPVDFRVSLKGYAEPLVAPGADLRLWFQTNGMGSAWWSAPATLEGDTVTATFGPAQDTGADRVSLFFGAPSNVFASAVLRLTHSPGFAPASLPLPAPVLDFAAVELRNLHALTNGWSLGGGAEMPEEVSSITNALKNYDAGGQPSPALTYGWYLDGTAKAAEQAEMLGSVGQAYMPLFRYDANASRWVSEWQWGTSEVAYLSDIPAPPDLSGYATLYSVNAVSNLAASAGAKADTAIAYLQGDDAKVVVTNYDSSVTMPSHSLQQRVEDADGGTNYWKVVWNELTRWNRFTGDGFDWAAWCGFDCFRTNVLAQLDQKADRAWGFYDSHAGNWAPDGYTWISSPKIAIAAGLAYQRTMTSEGAVWVLESNGLVTETGGNVTNGFFRISDDAGNTLFEIVKGDKRTIGADAGSVTQTIVMGVTHLHITYAVVSESHPTLRICPALELGEWKSEDASDCVANVSWTGSSGAWVAEVWGKTALPRMFVKAEYEVGGETYIKNAAPVSADGGILCTDGIHKVRPVWHSGGSVTLEVVP